MNNFSFLVVFGLMVAAAQAVPAPDEEAILMAANKCRKGTAITQESLKEILKGTAHDEPDEKIKCYFKCFFEDLGMMGNDGTIMLDAKHNHFMDCSKKAADVMNLCDKAYQFDKCIHQQFPDLPIA